MLMHYYLLDPCTLSSSDFEKRQTELLGLAHEFNIRGETGRISPLRSIRDIVLDAERKAVRTLIICGDDDTFNQVLGALKGRQFTLGFVPLVPNTQLGELLGTPDIPSAIKTIAARRITLVDTAKIGALHFFSYLEFGANSKPKQGWSFFKLLAQKVQPTKLKVLIDELYILECDCLGGVLVNAKGWRTSEKDLGKPNDGLLDLVLAPYNKGIKGLGQAENLNKSLLSPKSATTRIPVRTIRLLEPVGLPLTIAGRQVAKIPIHVTVEPQFLQLIVGRDRTF